MKYPVDYNIDLADIKPGQIFSMLNYDGELFIKIDADSRYTVRHEYTFCREYHPLHTDGHHEAIVSLKTGAFFYMAKIKPCRIML